MQTTRKLEVLKINYPKHKISNGKQNIFQYKNVKYYGKSQVEHFFAPTFCTSYSVHCVHK